MTSPSSVLHQVRAKQPPAGRELGMVVVEIGVAITKAAEFVVFRLGQSSDGDIALPGVHLDIVRSPAPRLTTGVPCFWASSRIELRPPESRIVSVDAALFRHSAEAAGIVRTASGQQLRELVFDNGGRAATRGAGAWGMAGLDPGLDELELLSDRRSAVRPDLVRLGSP